MIPSQDGSQHGGVAVELWNERHGDAVRVQRQDPVENGVGLQNGMPG